MKYRWSWILGLLPLLMSAQAAWGDAAAGREIVAKGTAAGAVACMSCHGMDGAGQTAAGFPQLAGLNAAYIVKQLQDYAGGRRVNSVMAPIAKALSEQERDDVAAYFAGLSPVAGDDGTAAAKVLQQGRDIAQIGLWKKDVPACYSCHGPSGTGVGVSFPRITSQHKTYLVQQLRAWREGTRKNDPNQLMKTIAQKLTPSEIEAVTAYLSSKDAAQVKSEAQK